MPSNFDAFILGGGSQPPEPAPLPANRPPIPATRRTCQRCKTLKLKCDGNKPCRYCERKGCGDQCSYQNEEYAAVLLGAADVEQIKFHGRSLEVVLPPKLAMAPTKQQLLSKLVGVAGGDRNPGMQRMVAGFTDELYDAVLTGIESMRLVQTGSECSDVQTAIVTSPAMHRNPIVEVIEDNEVFGAYFSECFDLATMNWTAFRFNRCMCEWLGASADEMLVRIGRGEFQMRNVTTELEFLTMLLDAWTMVSNEDLTYYIISNGAIKDDFTPKSALCRWYRVREVSEDGLQVNFKNFIRPVPFEEYEEHMKLYPDTRVRKLVRASGEERSTAQMIADHGKDRRTTLVQMKNSPIGRLRLNALAAEVRNRFEPIVRQAQQIKNGLSDPGSPALSEAPPFSSASPSPVPLTPFCEAAAPPTSTAEMTGGGNWTTAEEEIAPPDALLGCDTVDVDWDLGLCNDGGSEGQLGVSSQPSDLSGEDTPETLQSEALLTREGSQKLSDLTFPSSAGQGDWGFSFVDSSNIHKIDFAQSRQVSGLGVIDDLDEHHCAVLPLEPEGTITSGADSNLW